MILILPGAREGTQRLLSTPFLNDRVKLINTFDFYLHFYCKSCKGLLQYFNSFWSSVLNSVQVLATEKPYQYIQPVSSFQCMFYSHKALNLTLFHFCCGNSSTNATWNARNFQSWGKEASSSYFSKNIFPEITDAEYENAIILFCSRDVISSKIQNKSPKAFKADI